VNVSNGGVPKRPVPGARVSALGLDGDRQRDTRYHGGPERALCLFSFERIEALAAEGHAIGPGTLGENVTVAGLDWDRVSPGAHYRLGRRVVIEITGYASPCAKIRPAFAGGEHPRVSQKAHPGWSRVYARVLAPGAIVPGDAVRPLTAARPRPAQKLTRRESSL
jgi:MOSC domain-containing protein YiiM